MLLFSATPPPLFPLLILFTHFLKLLLIPEFKIFLLYYLSSLSFFLSLSLSLYLSVSLCLSASLSLALFFQTPSLLILFISTSLNFYFFLSLFSIICVSFLIDPYSSNPLIPHEFLLFSFSLLILSHFSKYFIQFSISLNHTLLSLSLTHTHTHLLTLYDKIASSLSLILQIPHLCPFLEVGE